MDGNIPLGLLISKIFDIGLFTSSQVMQLEPLRPLLGRCYLNQMYFQMTKDPMEEQQLLIKVMMYMLPIEEMTTGQMETEDYALFRS